MFGVRNLGAVGIRGAMYLLLIELMPLNSEQRAYVVVPKSLIIGFVLNTCPGH